MKLNNKILFTLLSLSSFALQAQAKDLRFKFEVYAVNKEDYVADRDATVALLKASKSELITAAEIVSPSGQRAKAEAQREVIYAASGDSTGLTLETRKVGSLIEVDPVLGADAYTVDLAYSVMYSTAAPEAQWRKIDVGGGFSAEDPKFSTQQLTSQISMFVGPKWTLLGVLPEVNSETGAVLKKVYPVYVQVQLQNPGD